MSKYHTKTVTELSAMLQAGEVSSVELTQYFLDRIKNNDDRLNSFITVCEEQAMAQAKASDASLKAGNAPALTGVPVGSAAPEKAPREMGRAGHWKRQVLAAPPPESA